MLPKLNTYTPDCSFQPLRGNVLRITFLIPNYTPREPLLRPNSGSPLAEASRGTLWLHLAPRLCSTFSFISKGQTKTLVSIHIHELPTLALSPHIHTHTHIEVGWRWCAVGFLWKPQTNEKNTSIFNSSIFFWIIITIMLKGKCYLPTSPCLAHFPLANHATHS